MHMPSYVKMSDLVYRMRQTSGVSQQLISGAWVPARYYPMSSLKKRFKLAWGVFTGKYDALHWE